MQKAQGKQRTRIMEEMERDLIKLYRQETSKYTYMFQSDVYNIILNHPAPRYYVTPEWAYKRIKGLQYGDTSCLDGLNPLKKEMYLSLFETVKRLSEKPSFRKKTLHYILQYAVLEPAPKFYIGISRMGVIFRKNRMSHRN